MRVECHETCGDCVNGTSSGCVDCASRLLLWRSRCLTSCVAGTYDSLNGFCLACPEGCSLCESSTNCSACTDSHYWVASSRQCVTAENCPDGTYANTATRRCSVCAYPCYTCSGPTDNDCLVCNFAQGYSRSGGGKRCYSLVCVDGTYLRIDAEARLASCPDCNSRCQTCVGPQKDDCLMCKQGYFQTKAVSAYNGSANTSRVGCQTCGEMAEGFIETKDYQCQGKTMMPRETVEICGDGMNMGQVECDDGNNIDGDGCSASCKVERGYKCTPSADSGPDICLDALLPNGVLSVGRDNAFLWLDFSEPVRSVSYLNSTVI